MGFEWAYRSGTPPWDIGRPQPAIVRLAERELIGGDVIDIGCGTGENALYLASLGSSVVGVDTSPTAIARAREKGRKRGLGASFVVADALALESLGRCFDTAIDCGLFHTLSDEERPIFERSLRGAVRPGGRYVLLCFSETQPGDSGPRRITQAEIRATFKVGWRVDSIVAERFAARLPGSGANAWLALLARTGTRRRPQHHGKSVSTRLGDVTASELLRSEVEPHACYTFGATGPRRIARHDEPVCSSRRARRRG